MAENKLKAKNVVSFSGGGAQAKETAPANEEAGVLNEVDETIEKVEKAARQPEESVKADASEPAEPVETKPLNLRRSRYLDDTPQDGDWADDAFDEFDDYEEDARDISTFAEVFIPLHSDSTATVVRKGMAIVCVIVILCCLVALAMRGGQLSAIAQDFSAQVEQAVQAAAVLLNL
ncbi:MAG: hypothetical protein J6T14_03105 [Clostridia bacterium]|nr:hypothetical protein [Clostridia bacterium]